VTGLVTHLRRQLEEAQRELLATDSAMQIQRLEADAQQAAEALAVLAEGGIKAADPDNWWGLIPLSTVNPIHGVDETGTPNRIRLSHSTLATAVHSPLQWFIYQISTSQSSLLLPLGLLSLPSLKNPQLRRSAR